MSSTPLTYEKDQQIKKVCIVNRLSDAIINREGLTDDVIVKVAKQLQDGLKNEFMFYYGYTAKLYYCPKNVAESQEMWNMYLLDASDKPGALGYHDANDLGLPQGKVFVQTALSSRAKWSVTLDHEIKEALTDPWGMANFFQDYGTTKRLIAFENCDPVEADKYSYMKGGISLSNFVTPYWMHPFNDTAEYDKSVRYDLLQKINESFKTLPGCHASYYYITDARGKYTGWMDKNFRKTTNEGTSELQQFKPDKFFDEYTPGDEYEIYSPMMKGTNWHIMFKTPDAELVSQKGITKDEVFDAIKSAFSPAPGSRRDIRYKVSKAGGALNNLEYNDNDLIKKVFPDIQQKPEEITSIDNSFDRVLEEEESKG